METNAPVPAAITERVAQLERDLAAAKDSRDAARRDCVSIRQLVKGHVKDMALQKLPGDDGEMEWFFTPTPPLNPLGFSRIASISPSAHPQSSGSRGAVADGRGTPSSAPN